MRITLILFLGGLCLTACESKQSSEQQNDKKADKANTQPEENNITWLDTFIGNDYLIDDQHSYIGFRVNYFGHSPIRGRFDKFDGSAFFDPSHPSATHAMVTIDASSINTGNEQRDEDLSSNDTWFDTPHFPEIRFESGSTKSTVNGFTVSGTITMKDTTIPVEVNFKPSTPITRDWAKNEQLSLSATCSIDRQSFGVFGGDFWSESMEDGTQQLGDSVFIEMDLHLRRPDYLARLEDADDNDPSKTLLQLYKEQGFDIAYPEMSSLAESGELSAGKLSTIAYTLQAWNEYPHARMVIMLREQFFPGKSSTQVQLAINALLQNSKEVATQYLHKAMELDDGNSRALLYLKTLELMP